MERSISSTLRHLRAFQMVARLRNIRKAADAVRLTQPAVTLAIAKLECQVEAALFERRSRGTYLTREGEILAARVDRLFIQIETVLAEFCHTRPNGIEPAAMADRLSRAHIKALTTMASPVAEDDSQGVSRSSVHRAVRDIERLLGLELMVFGPDGLFLNPTGIELARRIGVAMAELDCALSEIAAHEDRWLGQLRLGALPLTGSFVLGLVLNRLMAMHPEAQTQMRTGDYSALSPALLRGEIDFIVGLVDEARQDDRLVQQPLVPLTYVLVARKGHPLADRNSVGIRDIQDFDWVAPNRNTARRQTFDILTGRMDRQPAANIHASSLSTLRLLLTGSDRLALLTSFEFEIERHQGDLVALPFGPIAPGHALGVVTRANWSPPPLHRKFLEMVRAEAERIVQGALPGHGQPAPRRGEAGQGVWPH